MRILYLRSDYISHLTASEDYIACLRQLGHDVRTGPDAGPDADLAVLHDDPLSFPEAFEYYGFLRRMPTVGYCVWENERLSPLHEKPLELVRTVWTASEFCRRSYSTRHPRVRVLPHVVRRPKAAPEDLDFVRELLRPAEGTFRFLSIVDGINPRKNIETLIAAFQAARERAGRPLTLVLKQYRLNLDLTGLPGVFSLGDMLSEGRMAALHQLTDAYVSAHHSEGWGLGLSTAMAFGKPVIATGYSGNMEFMDADNSFPVPYVLAPVSDLMCERIPLFTPDMLWADIDFSALVRTMKNVAEGRFDPELPRRAAAIVRRFGPRAVTERLRELLSEIKV